MRALGVAVTLLLVGSAGIFAAQSRRPASPPGIAATHVGGHWDEREGYVGGGWIEIHSGRPIRRGRDLFGPPDWAEALNDGADVWRAGANFSTRLLTEVPIEIGSVRVEPGEYTLFIDLKDEAWTLIVSTWPAQQGRYDYENKEALFGAYDYSADRDVLRAPMRLDELPWSVDQLTWQFLDMNESAGRIAILWDAKIAAVDFRILGSG